MSSSEQPCDKAKLPTYAALSDKRSDARDIFIALKEWARVNKATLAVEASKLNCEHRRQVLVFLQNLPEKRPVFRNQAKALLRTFSEIPEWCRDGAALECVGDCAAAAQPKSAATFEEFRPRGRTEAELPRSGDTPSRTPGVALGAPRASSPSPPMRQDVLEGMPPPEAFQTRSRYDPGDTFKDFRKWARRLPYWDLSAAGGLLPEQVRRDVFNLIIGIAGRKLYTKQAREVLTMLLPIDEWVAGAVADEAALDRVMGVEDLVDGGAKPPIPGGEVQPPPPPARAVPGVPAQGPPVATLVPGRLQDLDDFLSKEPGAGVATGLRARVQTALCGGTPLSSPDDLVRLYAKSGLGGEATLSGKATDGDLLGLLLVIAGQRMRDLFVDPLQEKASLTGASVHFPHFYIDLRRRNVYNMPPAVHESVERKIRTGGRWTSIEKAHVLRAKHEYSLRYVLAYCLARAQAESRRAAIWIPLGMDTGSQGHANAVCLQAVNGSTTYRALVYDPNYDVDNDGGYWVHAKKAVADALPGVKRLLSGTGIDVLPSADLFGHGLQTLLGTTRTSRGWFSKSVVTTQRGYPICGSVVYLLAAVWVTTCRSREPLVDVVAVEAEIAKIVTEADQGKLLVQQKIAAFLTELITRLSEKGSHPFGRSLQLKLDNDKRDWPGIQSGDITVSIPNQHTFTYKL